MENTIKNILIIDDSIPFLNIFKKLLLISLPGAEIKTVSTFKEGYEIVTNSNSFELIFIDFRFPTGENGTELLEAALKTGNNLKKAFVLVTSEPTPSNIERAKSLGAIDVIAKPPTREILKQAIDRAYTHLKQ